MAVLDRDVHLRRESTPRGTAATTAQVASLADADRQIEMDAVAAAPGPTPTVS